MTEKEEKYADRVNKLLRKAESTDSEAEAEEAVKLAQKLITKHAISQALLDERADKPSEEKIELTVVFDGSYQKALKNIAFAVMKNNDCRGFFSDNSWKKPPTQKVTVAGYERDAKRVELLSTSLQIQCISAMKRWWKEAKNTYPYAQMDKGEQWRERRQFIYGFVDGLDAQLAEARKEGEKEAAAEEAKRSGKSVEEASESMALMIRSRADNVGDWFDEKYGSSIRSVRPTFTPGSHSSQSAGRTAGRSANANGNAPAGVLGK